jgi:hypothetical protein
VLNPWLSRRVRDGYERGVDHPLRQGGWLWDSRNNRDRSVSLDAGCRATNTKAKRSLGKRDQG